MIFSSELFWKADIKELERGYIYDEQKEIYICLICGKYYEKGVIYSFEQKNYEAEKRMKEHIKEEHGSVVSSLLNMDKKYTGLSDIQKELLQYFYEGKSDNEIAKKVKSSSSTIRNHRFRLKEKAKQAKVFLTIMNLIESRINDEDKIIDIHKNAKMIDERYAITKTEKERTIKKYVLEDGTLTQFPNKEKEKLIILMWIMKRFEYGITYTEKEVNEQIKEAYDDYVLIRRYLIQYGFINRKSDGSCYWVVF